ncbi:branched-chain amino acid ABC transporter permease [Ramlibacter tataouinensis]|uniref:branched-chain amino acid ABC transporter permease n=1 Tax=Ramlibacter tataouinensis TaxID=94132 RepID=UPI0022F40772|nr:branched-chain amino acid ABC transporter permease [Ramlibacter tataouinensis]WBY02816.1 branched-chain amino acid ABC transporter permease [Ramlibacter tataouinensis]
MLYRRAGIFHTSYAHDRALFPIPFERRAMWALLAVALAAPWIFSSLALSSYIRPWLIWTSAVLGLNLVLGWAGQFHFGYAAIMGMGAYASVHAARNGIPWEIAVVLGGLTATGVGVVFAFAALRVKGLYLALSTLAMQFVMDWVISHVPAISGGVSATLQAPPMKLLGQAITSEVGTYYVVLAWTVAVTVFMLNLRRSALGRALVAVREKDYAAAVIGVQAFRYKLVAFAASAFIGGVSGAMLIFGFYHAVTPEQFAVNVSIEVLAMVIVGGLGSIIGSFFGTAFILLLPGQMNELISAIARAVGADIGVETLAHIPYMIYGASIIAVLLIEPMGLGKLYGNIRNYLMVWPFGYVRK